MPHELEHQRAKPPKPKKAPPAARWTPDVAAMQSSRSGAPGHGDFASQEAALRPPPLASAPPPQVPYLPPVSSSSSSSSSSSRQPPAPPPLPPPVAALPPVPSSSSSSSSAPPAHHPPGLGHGGGRHDEDEVAPSEEPYQPIKGDMITFTKVVQMRNDWYDAALRIIDESLAKNPGNQEALRDMRLAFEFAKTSMPKYHAQNVIDEAELERVFPIELPARLAANLVSAIPDTPHRAPMVAKLREAYIRHINAGDWSTITRDIKPRKGPGLTSTITPVNQEFDDTYHGETGAVGKRYGHTGLGSMAPRLGAGGRKYEESHRPTNLWHTQLSDADGQPLFEAFRSGAFADPELQKSGLEESVAHSKVCGVLEAMLIKQLRTKDDAEIERILSGDMPLESTVIAIDLLSDAILKGDKGQVETHHAAIRNVDGRSLGFRINVRGQLRTVTAKFNIVDFNLAVNQLGTNLQRTGARQGERNRTSIERLGGLIREYDAHNGFLYEHLAPDEQQALGKRSLQVHALYDQFLRLGGSHVGDYEAAAILANLAYLMGHEVHFNCKSGKDRTGLMDANSKHLAAELGRRRADPTLGPEELTPRAGWIGETEGESAHGRHQMIWEGGNLQVLERNVGGQSLKVGDAAGMPGTIDRQLRDNVGGAEALKELRGLHRYTMIDSATNPPIAPLQSKFRSRAKEELRKLTEEAKRHQPPEQ